MTSTPAKEQCEHIYSVRLPGFSRWTPDYSLAFEMAVGVKPENWKDEDPAPGEDRISIMHKRGREYVLDLSKEFEFECCMNRRYDCGHVAYGPPKRLPKRCPECHPTATDGGPEQSASEHVYGSSCPHCGHDRAETVGAEIEGRGSTTTVAIRECNRCGHLWGEPRDWEGVIADE